MPSPWAEDSRRHCPHASVPPIRMYCQPRTRESRPFDKLRVVLSIVEGRAPRASDPSHEPRATSHESLTPRRNRAQTLTNSSDNSGRARKTRGATPDAIHQEVGCENACRTVKTAALSFVYEPGRLGHIHGHPRRGAAALWRPRRIGGRRAGSRDTRRDGEDRQHQHQPHPGDGHRRTGRVQLRQRRRRPLRCADHSERVP